MAPPTVPRRLRRVVPGIRRADDRALDWVSTTPHGPVRPVLGVVARATDLRGPVVPTSIWYVTRGTPEGRAAIGQGWRAMTLTAVAESVVKPMTDRGRPAAGRLSAAQRRSASPSTSAFPSGHLGGLTAFAVAVSRGVARLRPWLTASTVGTAYARVYTGRHYLSDVAGAGRRGGRPAAHAGAPPGHPGGHLHGGADGGRGRTPGMSDGAEARSWVRSPAGRWPRPPRGRPGHGAGDGSSTSSPRPRAAGSPDVCSRWPHPRSRGWGSRPRRSSGRA